MSRRRSVTILGATGSIGTSTLDLIERDPERFEVIALTAHSDVTGLAAAARRTKARLAAIGDMALLPALREALAGSDIKAIAGPEAIVEGPWPRLWARRGSAL
jgi:1-deoxy-D-xylulose-5-phosphate reductoisomerase